MKRILLILSIAVAAMSCTAKLDGDLKKFAESRQEVEKSLNDTQKKGLSEFINIAKGGALGLDFSKLDGKSYDDLENEYGSDVDDAAKENIKVQDEKIKGYKAEVDLLMKGKSLLDKITVKDYKAFVTEGKYSWDKEVGMYMTFTNELDEGLKKIECAYSLVMKEGGDTLVSDRFNYAFDLPMTGEKSFGFEPNYSQKDKFTKKRVEACDFNVKVIGFKTKNYSYNPITEDVIDRLSGYIKDAEEEKAKSQALLF